MIQTSRPALVAALLLVVCGCAPTIEEPSAKLPEGSTRIKGAGATFPSPLFKKWFASYSAANPATSVTYDAVGSGEGIRRFVGNDVKPAEIIDFGASDAAMTDEEIARVPKSVVLLPITAGSVVLAYNLPDLNDQLRLSREAYAGIFLGEITNWNDRRIAASNPGLTLPKLTIAPIVRQDASGTTFAFTKHLDAISEKWRSLYGASTLINWPGGAIRAKGNEGVAGQIQHSVGSIGYVGYEFARKLDLHMATLENREGRFIAPSEHAATAALAAAEMPENLRVFVPNPTGPDSYPIVTFSWVLLYKNYPDRATANSLRDLFHWCLTSGQQYAADLGYIPLPAATVQQATSALDTLRPE